MVTFVRFPKKDAIPRLVEGLRDRHERDAVGIEQLDELGEISERTGQPVDLVHQHDVDLASAHLGQELLQRWAAPKNGNVRMGGAL
jgi:hypothetical protein